uniref:Protein kinase domain-containing protein n=1 Tax=Leersia perrieri TaxID=77586 RepID=A0A0D9WZW8_9ORYZ
MAGGDDAAAPAAIKLSISGAALAALLQRCVTATGDCDGLLSGHASRVPAPPPSFSDYDDPSPAQSTPAISISITGHSSLSQPSSLSDPLGRFHLPSSASASAAASIGFFSSRRRTVLRPSMREVALAHSLSKTLALTHPLLFLVCSSTPNLSTHSYDYRAFLLIGSRLVPTSLIVVNLGPGSRDQYNSFVPMSPMPSLPSAAAGDTDAIGDQNVMDGIVDGFGVGRLQGITGSAGGQMVEMNGMYAGMLRRLEKLAREVEKSNLLVLKQRKWWCTGVWLVYAAMAKGPPHSGQVGPTETAIISHRSQSQHTKKTNSKAIWRVGTQQSDWREQPFVFIFSSALQCGVCSLQPLPTILLSSPSKLLLALFSGDAMRRHALLLLAAAALLVISHIPFRPVAAQPWQMCGTNGNYTVNSTYQSNLNQLAAALPRNASTGGSLFASGAVGTVPDAVYALAICRGDANATACRDCVATIFQDAQQLCPYNKDVSIVYDTCYLRFSNLNFLASTDNSGVVDLYNTGNVSGDVGRYDRAVTGLLNATAAHAAANSSRRFFATGVMVGFDAQFPRIYAMAQCTPDLSPADCRRCLDAMVGRWWRTFEPNTQGARSVGARCNMRVELYSFYDIPSMLQLQAEAVAPSPSPAPPLKPPAVPDTTTGGKGRSGAGKILAIVMPIVAAVLAAAMIGFCFWRRRRPAKTPPPRPLQFASRSEDIESFESLILDLSTLRTATDNFSENNKLGEGGFGVVYKGSLPYGQDIAVKRLSQSSVQGMGELKNELVLVAKLQHKNLVRLVGVCLEDHERMLVYEYMPNRSLDTILFDPEKSSLLDWGRRLKIINGVARGMQYLHEDSQLKIVHRDLKASNVLLDSDYNPKISDFGLARLFGGDQTQDVTNRVVGTYGYMAPEYAMRGHYSVKSDVFSFGVLILEIVTGRRNNGSFCSEQSVDLLSIIWEHWTMGTIMEMVDRSMSEGASGGEIVRCIHVGLLCVQENPASRPAMSTVNVMLSSGTVSLHAPSRPAFYIRKGSDGDGGTGSYSESFVGTLPSSGRSVPMSPNEMSITELEPR